MAENTPQSAADAEMKKLERSLAELLQTVDRLRDENRSLKARQEALSTERAALMQKNEQVRARVEAMIGRLKSMEHGA